ncbi:nucleotidyl transferase AbiEii/AbiGii toxin family protein [Ferruginibacter sp.]
MPEQYLHERSDFIDLIRIIADEESINPFLVEKDYWIMHVLFGLKSQQFEFELKGGTSLSKAYKIIDRFSEDIDIHIKPPASFGINENPKNTNPNNSAKRKDFYDWLANTIKIDGIVSIERDTAFDDEQNYRSGGIRLRYDNKTLPIDGIKEGILLEAGFDNVTPNHKITISSWAYDRAIQNTEIKIIDNRAKDIVCYDPGYTFVEKLQTIATKYRQEQLGDKKKVNFMRQYYDVYSLLAREDVLQFIGTPDYEAHKKKRFPPADYEIPVKENQAFLLESEDIRKDYTKRYEESRKLYYKGQPPFEELLERIKLNIEKL